MSLADGTWLRIFFATGVVLRAGLFWMNQPQHSYDDHYQPIFHILKHGTIAPPLTCWECHQPPVFYALSAMVAWAATALGADRPTVLKLLQALPLLYALLTLFVLERILRRLPLPSRARLFAFGLICFLPAHFYISAMHSNDTLSFLFVALAVLVLFRVIESGFASRWLAVWSVVLSLAIFTKLLNLIVVPMAASALLLAGAPPYRLSIRQLAEKAFVVFCLPTVLLGLLGLWYNYVYGTPFVHAMEVGLLNLDQLPGRDGMSLWTFKPWTFLEAPLIGPRNVGSFWTLLYGHFWFDVEPMFLWFTDYNDAAWDAYYQYLLRRIPYAGFPALSLWTRAFSAGLLLLGFVPLVIGVVGAGAFLFGRSEPSVRRAGEARLQIVPLLVLLAFNLVGVVAVIVEQPFFCNTKATFLLGSIPTFAVCLGLGLRALESRTTAYRGAQLLLGLLFALATAHILHVFVSMVAVLG